MPAPLKALDLFAGTGWGVACQRLGIEEMGVEIMPEAVATREANGMHTLYRDVWDGLQNPVVMAAFNQWCTDGGTVAEFYDILIASPPCQTFSMAGKGAGRQALDEVIEAITAEAYKDPAALLAFGEKHDMRTALVLTPLAHVWRDRPRFVAMEQVPTVLPVWEACAEVMRGWGYSVEVANLHAEQYGVPQTRKRAILVARLDGLVSLPTPTHSRYYSRTPEKLDEGVLPWVSMAEALGWGGAQLPLFISNNKRAKSAGWTQTPGGGLALDRPAPTITAGHDSGNRGFLDEDGALRVATPDEVAALQSYPSGRGLTDRPSPTITGGGVETGGAEPIAKLARYTTAPGWTGSTERLSTDEAAILQSYPSTLRPEIDAWKWRDAPATTVAGDPRITAREHHHHGEQSKTSLKLERDEASTLQSFPRPFVWCGSKSKQFLQIGNAVPPLLAQAILSALTA